MKAKPGDKDAQAKYNECNKIVRRLAFEKAIAVDDGKKCIADQINLESMCMCYRLIVISPVAQLESSVRVPFFLGPFFCSDELTCISLA